MNRAFFIDVQGTLICDEKREPIKGACEFIDKLNSTEVPYVVITNNTKEKSSKFLEELKNKGLDIKNYIDPFSILTKEVRVKRVAAFGTEGFLEVLKSLGYELDFERPEALIISIKKDYDNEDYALMIEMATRTNHLVGMHETSTYSKDGKRYPGVGSIMNMIKYAVNKDYTVIGKPSFNFYDSAREMINKNFDEITVISDDMIGDLIGAKNLKMKTSLVLSGKVKDEKEILHTLENEHRPDFICKDMETILELFERGQI